MTRLIFAENIVPQKLVYGYDPEDVISVIKKTTDVSRLKRIIDFGSGNGLHAIEIAKEFNDSRVIGIEPSSPFFLASQKNKSETVTPNLSFLNQSIEDFYSINDQQVVDLIHCCMVFPFLSDPSFSLESFANSLSQNGIAVVTLFLIPDTYTTNEQLACEEFFRKALPSVRYVPRESSFEGFANSAGLQLLRKVMLPAPSRDRGDEVNSFKAKNIERRKIIEAEIRAEFNLESNADFRTAPMSTFILTKKSFQA